MSGTFLNSRLPWTTNLFNDRSSNQCGAEEIAQMCSFDWLKVAVSHSILELSLKILNIYSIYLANIKVQEVLHF